MKHLTHMHDEDEALTYPVADKVMNEIHKLISHVLGIDASYCLSPMDNQRLNSIYGMVMDLEVRVRNEEDTPSN